MEPDILDDDSQYISLAELLVDETPKLTEAEVDVCWQNTESKFSVEATAYQKAWSVEATKRFYFAEFIAAAIKNKTLVAR